MKLRRFSKATEFQNVVVADFETTTYPGIKETEVWMSIFCMLYSRDCVIHDNIDDFMEIMFKLKGNTKVYYHNLKFDGSFILNFLLKHNFKLALDTDGQTWLEDGEMQNNTCKSMISGMGQFYTITVCVNNRIVCFQDSYKILPFAVERVGKAFCKEFKKAESIDYRKFRRARGPHTEEEIHYGKMDVLTMVEALEQVFEQGHNKMTIGACCLSEFKNLYGKLDYERDFPDLTKDPCAIEGFENSDEYIRESYHGGYCYCKEPNTEFTINQTDEIKCVNKKLKNAEIKDKSKKYIEACGFTYDVNSLYPSVMHSMSGNVYPTGLPTYWIGDKIPENAIGDDKYYFVRIATKFNLKKDHLPTIQIKNDLRYNPRTYLKSSKTVYENKLFKTTTLHDERVVLTLSMTDFALIKKHYKLTELEILDGCWFNAQLGLFDKYIDKYAEIKMNSVGAEREFAKLFLNNLYGKLASSTQSDYKIPLIDEKGKLSFKTITANDKKAGYIACGSAITAYARTFTITVAQLNYDEFIYADTDSIHTTRQPKDMIGMKTDPVRFCHWAIESAWDKAIFCGPKTYIEHVTHEWNKKENCLMPVKKPFYDIKCAGMGKDAKKNLNRVLSNDLYDETNEDDKKILKVAYKKMNDDIKKEIEYRKEMVKFLCVPLVLTDFKPGLKVPGSLSPKQIPGGTLLEEKFFNMKQRSS